MTNVNSVAPYQSRHYCILIRNPTVCNEGIVSSIMSSAASDLCTKLLLPCCGPFFHWTQPTCNYSLTVHPDEDLCKVETSRSIKLLYITDVGRVFHLPTTCFYMFCIWIKVIPLSHLLPGWPRYISTFLKYISHPASTVRQAASSVFKYLGKSLHILFYQCLHAPKANHRVWEHKAVVTQLSKWTRFNCFALL